MKSVTRCRDSRMLVARALNVWQAAMDVWRSRVRNNFATTSSTERGFCELAAAVEINQRMTVHSARAELEIPRAARANRPDSSPPCA